MIPKFKPYDLVLVDEGDYTYIGEVMSMVTPEQTLMVRRVPGHPGTLEEQPVTKLRKWAGRIRGVSYAIAKGPGQFPVEMLRYDMAVPVNFRLLDTNFGTAVEMLEGHKDEELMVAMVMPTGRYTEWTSARWSSFLWYIREVKQEPWRVL